MTHNVSQMYTGFPAAGQTPYDLPPENFQLTIGNVNGATADASMTDPLTGSSDPVTIVSRTAGTIVV